MADSTLMPMLPMAPKAAPPTIGKKPITEEDLWKKSQQFASLLWQEMVKPMIESAKIEGDNEMTSYLMAQYMGDRLAEQNDLGINAYLRKSVPVIEDQQPIALEA